MPWRIVLSTVMKKENILAIKSILLGTVLTGMMFMPPPGAPVPTSCGNMAHAQTTKHKQRECRDTEKLDGGGWAFSAGSWQMSNIDYPSGYPDYYAFDCKDGKWVVNEEVSAQNKAAIDEQNWKHEEAEKHRDDLYRALLTRPLTEAETDEVWQMGESVLPSFSPYCSGDCGDRHKEFLEALYQQARLRELKSSNNHPTEKYSDCSEGEPE